MAADRLGDLLTADHFVFAAEASSGPVIQDEAAMWFECFPKATRAPRIALRRFSSLLFLRKKCDVFTLTARTKWRRRPRAPMAPRCIHTESPSVERSGGASCAKGYRGHWGVPHKVGLASRLVV